MDSEGVHSNQVNENEQYQEENQGDHEKKSVLNKVKAKAKKIKDTIKKHGQQVLDQYGRETSSNEDQSSPVHHDMDEDEKIAYQDQPVGNEDVKSTPPTYEQVESFVKSAEPESAEVESLDKLGVNSGGGKRVMEEELHQEPRVLGAAPVTAETNENKATELQGKTFAEEEMPGNLEKPAGFDEDLKPHSQGSRPEAYNTPSNYQIKNIGPSGTVDESEDVRTIPPTLEQVEKFVKVAAPASEQVENLDELGVNHGGTMSVIGEQPRQESRDLGASPTMETDENMNTEAAKTFAEEEKKPGQGEFNLERPKGFDEDLHKPESRSEAYTPPSYQTKFTDPTETGTDEIDITPVEKSFERMNVQDEPKPVSEPKVLPNSGETQYSAAESQGQFVPEPDLSSATKTQQYPPPESHDQNLPELSSATETQYPSERIYDKFVPEISTTAAETQYPSGETGHEKYFSDTISRSKNSDKENPEVTEQTFNSNTDTVEEQPKYESSVEKPSNQQSYTDDISSNASVIADKAVSDETAEASKFGYDEKVDGDKKVSTLDKEKSEDASKNSSGSTLGYGKKIASSMTEKLAPVYGKVAEVGSAVKSTVSGTRTVDNSSVGIETENVGKEQDKGVSVKDYLAEKLKPGEEDKALSQLISQTLYKRKEEPNKDSEGEDRDLTKVDNSSDAIKKHEIEAVEKERGNGKSEDSYVNSPGKGMVGKIKGVVGSWFGKSEENQSSQVAGGEDLAKNKNGGGEVGQVGQDEGERRIQE